MMDYFVLQNVLCWTTSVQAYSDILRQAYFDTKTLPRTHRPSQCIPVNRYVVVGAKVVR